MGVATDRLASAATYRVVVVDDSQIMRRWLGSMVSSDPRLTLVGTAGSAEEARRIIKQTDPDVLTLDVEMPGMNGLEFLSHLMRLRPMPVLMLAGDLRRNSPVAHKARALGAAACLAKPTIPTPEALATICDAIWRVARGDRLDDPGKGRTTDKIILIGASTGGVTALEHIFPQLPENGPPIVVAQHMPQDFLARFVERLDRKLPQNVAFAEVDDRLTPGDIRIAPSQQRQTGLTWHSGAWHVQAFQRGAEDLFCPSVDVLFGSAAPWAAQVGAMILTGIGNDGAKGMLMLRRNGAQTVAQSEKDCAVYGMPAAALALDAVEEECDVDHIGHRMAQLLLADGCTA